MKKKHIGHIPPGTLLPQKSGIVRIHEYLYTEQTEGNRWVSVLGLPGDQDLELLGNRLNVHPMILASIQKDSVHSRVLDQGSYIFIAMPFFSLHMPSKDEPRIETRGVYFFLFPHMLVSIYSGKDNIFMPIEERLTHSKGRIRKLGEDYAREEATCFLRFWNCSSSTWSRTSICSGKKLRTSRQTYSSRRIPYPTLKPIEILHGHCGTCSCRSGNS